MDASPNQSNNVIVAGNSYTLADGTEFQFTPSEDGYYYVKPSDADKAVYMQVYETNTYDDGSVDSYYRPVYGDSILVDSVVQQAFSLKAGLTYNIDIHDYHGDSADTGFGFYKAETYQSAYKLENDKGITISKGALGLCEIEGESGTLYYIGFSKTVDTRDLSMGISFGTSIQDGDTAWYPVILGDSKKFSFYFNDTVGNNGIIQPLTEDVQVTVKTDLSVVESYLNGQHKLKYRRRQPKQFCLLRQKQEIICCRLQKMRMILPLILLVGGMFNMQQQTTQSTKESVLQDMN